MAITTETFEGTPGGMNLHLPAQELSEFEARYLQDILVDHPGLTRRRGPVAAIDGLVTTGTPATGLVQTLDPNGTARFGLLHGDDSTGYLGLLSADGSSKVDISWNGVLPTNPYRIVDAKAALNGGAWIGSSSEYDSNAPVQTLALWKGGNKADYSTGTVTVTRGSLSMTGSGTSWLANIVPGMFIFANTDDPYTMTLLGVVKSVESNTALTLVDPSPYACTAKAYSIKSIRGFCPRVGEGRITTATSSTTVNGGVTKFKDQKLDTGVWQLYRASDWAFIGKVSSVTTNIQLVLTANAAIALNNERYIAIRADGDWSINTMAEADRKVGFLNALYAERQWFANLGQRFETTSRVWYSDPSDPEVVDLSPYDGDFVDIGSTHGTNAPIRAMMPATNALVVIKDNEAFGIFGTSPSNFSPKKIHDDGTLCGMSVQPYGGGVLWAGREGVHFFDGVQTQNITQDKLGDYYKKALQSFNPNTHRMWSMMIREHYMLFLEDFDPSVAVVKGTESSTPNSVTISINMTTGAITFFTNVGIRGSVVLPASSGMSTWFLANSNAPNLVTNPSFETDTTAWDVYEWPSVEGGTIAASTEQAKFGDKSLKVTPGKRDGNRGVQSYPTAFTTVIGETYTLSAWVYLPADHAIFTGEPVQLRIGDANSPSQVSYYGVDDLTAGWNRISTTFVATATSHYFYVNLTWLDVGGLTGVLPFYLDGMQFEQASNASNYWEGNNEPGGYIVDAATLFDEDGLDEIATTSSSTLGPDFYFESKKYKAGDSLRKKLFKQLAINYLAQGGSLSIDTVVGLNNVGRTSSTTFPATVYTWDNMPGLVATWDALDATYPTWSQLIESVYRPKRVKFLKRNQHFAFRLYQTDSDATKVILGPFQIGYKLQRPGRI